MNFNTKILNKFTFLIFLFSVLNISTNWKHLLATESISEIDKLFSEIKSNSEESSLESEYIIEGGDSLYIDFKDIENFSNIYPVNLEGKIVLPEIEQLYVEGLNLKELKFLLNNKFKKAIISPDISVSISTYRPVEVYISGAVKYPGLYLINPAIDLKTVPLKTPQKPTVFLALQFTRGLLNNADLKNINIVRKNSISNGGGKIKTSINLLSLVLNGDQSQNIRIFDGGSIFVPTSDILIKDQILAVNKTNLNPREIKVFITGNVVRRGGFNLARGSTLNQAISATGGKKILSGRIEFIRFTDDGNTNKRVFNYDLKAKANSYKNPILMDGDIVNVRRSILGTTSEVLGEFSSPIVKAFGLYKIFD